MSVAISLVWLIPGLNPAASATPLWSILPAIALALIGTAIYKRWELRQPDDACAIPPGLEPVPDAMHSYDTQASGKGGQTSTRVDSYATGTTGIESSLLSDIQ